MMHLAGKLTIASVMTANKSTLRDLLIGAVFFLPAVFAYSQERFDFSPYILKATELIAQSRLGEGYSKSASFSHDLTFGRAHSLPARHPPYTMCVSATLEVIITALNIYAKETGDYKPFAYLPKSTWERLRPFDLRGQIWIVKNSESYGTAHALQNFGMGIVENFRTIKPGAFVNLNRTNRTGHAVIFLGYLDRNGDILSSYGPSVAGFKYFSSQGTEKNGGFGYRYAFFSDVPCPNLSSTKKRDCGVIRSSNSMLLHAGTMLHPNSWNQAKALDQLSKEAFHIKNGDTEMLQDGDYNSTFFSGKTTDD